MAETTPAPINHNDAAAKPPMPVDPNAMSESRAMTKKAMGKGTSRGWIARELVPETAGNSAVIVVHPSVPAKSIAELVAFARTAPKPLNYATGNTYALASMAMFAVNNRIQLRLSNVVQFERRGLSKWP